MAYFSKMTSGTNRSINFYRTVYCSEDFYVTGYKSRLVETPDYGNRLLYCYETPTPMFGDVGEAVISEMGDCHIWIDPILAETIDTDTSYQVFLQAYGDGRCYVSERTPTRFTVIGTPGLRFGWELKAKQSGYSQYRIEKEGTRPKPSGVDYGAMALDHIQEINNVRGLNNE